MEGALRDFRYSPDPINLLDKVLELMDISAQHTAFLMKLCTMLETQLGLTVPPHIKQKVEDLHQRLHMDG
jgi:hypothetical protein